MDKHHALTRMARAVATGEPGGCAHALADAIRAGATPDELFAWMATVSAAVGRRRAPFDPNELSEAFPALQAVE